MNAFLERLRTASEPVLMLAIRSSRTADVVRIAAATGHHAVMIDLEHSTMSLDVAASLAATAADLGLFAFARVPEREYGAIGRLLDGGVVVQILIETPAGVANADAIAAVDGVDMLGFGANDFTAEIGAPGGYGDPRVTSAVETLAGAVHRHGKLLMVGGIGDPARLRELDQPGVCPLRLTGTDTDMLYAGAAARAERFTKNG